MCVCACVRACMCVGARVWVRACVLRVLRPLRCSNLVGADSVVDRSLVTPVY